MSIVLKEQVFESIPPTPGRSTVKRPDNDHMYSLGKVFKDKGYDAVFLYGGRGYFDNMNTFFSGNGYRIVDQSTLLSSQIDIAPTLLSLLHFSYDSFFFGKNILGQDFKERAFIANYQKLGILNKKELLILSPRQEISMVDTYSKEPSLTKINPSYPFVKEMISYYQGADYILKNSLTSPYWQKGFWKIMPICFLQGPSLSLFSIRA